MRNNKKIIPILLSIVLILGLTGCYEPAIENNSISTKSNENIAEAIADKNETKEIVEVVQETNMVEGKKEIEIPTPEGELKVYFLDVGQGDSIYIKTPKGDDILIDGGDNKYGDIVVNYLTELGVDDIEVIIATHPDADHIGGLDIVLNHFDVKAVYAPRVTHTTKTYEDFIIAVKNEGLKFKEAKAGIELPLDGIKAKFVAPVNTYSDDLNSWSAVLKLEFGEISFLFTGDATFKSEADMLSTNQDLEATVLKLGHHGANSSSSDDFLNKVNPKYGIVSAGLNNKYGHPTPEILAKLNNRGVEVYRTDLQGTIVATSDGKKVMFNTNPTTENQITNQTTAKESIDSKDNKKESENEKSNPGTNFTADIDNKNPSQNARINLNVSGINGAKYVATLHYKSKDTVYEGVVGTPLSINIGRASKGFEVIVDIEINHEGNIYTTKTSFTPK